jgi:hypothetical protein
MHVTGLLKADGASAANAGCMAGIAGVCCANA